jgi:alpha-1,3-fucosyltransferase
MQYNKSSYKKPIILFITIVFFSFVYFCDSIINSNPFINDSIRILKNLKEISFIKLKPTQQYEVDPEATLKCSIFNTSAKQFRVFINNDFYPKVVPLYHNKTINFDCLKRSNKTKKILMWTKFNGLPFRVYGFGYKKPFENHRCPITNCELTNDRKLINESDLVLFHLRNKINYLPTNETVLNKRQRWVHFIYESPIHCHLCDAYDNTFNLTATYTLESDFTSIYWTDSGLYWEENPDYQDKDVYSTKTNFSFALISWCSKSNGRFKYINELEKYISFDLFGKCGTPCPTDVDCRKYLSEKYKFFFAFENSVCRDYITEKFFDTLRYDVVVVVMGAGNYSYFIPKSGYINAMDFKTPKHLADYLLYLDSNKTAYNEYFKWKRYIRYQADRPDQAYLCEMCIRLHLEEFIGVERKVISNVKQRFGMEENCLGPNVFDTKFFEYLKGKKLEHSYIMSAE